jgi:hypothetical protein
MPALSPIAHFLYLDVVKQADGTGKNEFEKVPSINAFPLLSIRNFSRSNIVVERSILHTKVLYVSGVSE